MMTHTMMRNLAVGILAMVCLVAVPAEAQTVHTGAGIFNLDSLLGTYYLPDEQDTRTDRIAEDSLSSVHLTQIRGGVLAHHHAKHQETVFLVRGAGRLVLGKKKQKIAAGTIVSIPAGTPHSFHNLGKVPAVVISVFSPKFNARDRVFEN